MAIGERMRWFRNRLNMTQQELGEKLGFSKSTAIVRVGQYENEKRKPKQDMINQLGQIFGVAPEAINVPDIDNYHGLMHTLFTLEDRYGLTITKLDDQVCLKLDINHEHYDRGLAEDLHDWYAVKEKVTSGSILVAEYNQWRYNYPEEKVLVSAKRLDMEKNK